MTTVTTECSSVAVTPSKLHFILDLKKKNDGYRFGYYFQFLDLFIYFLLT